MVPSVLAKVLIMTVKDHGEPQDTVVCIIDGFFLLHLLTQVPEKFGDISIKILRILAANNAKQIFLIFDKYKSPSIKDNEHVLRANFNKDYCITGKICIQIPLNLQYKINIFLLGPEQNRPSDLSAELKNINFKESFVSFLVEHWMSAPQALDIIGDKEIYISYKKCYCYKVVRRENVCRIINEYSCEGHEEADTKIVFFLKEITGSGDVVIRCSDTDILVIALGNMAHVSQSLTVWLLFGTGNSQRFVNVSKIYESLGSTVCKALPAFHAFTGCDFNPAFYRLGKKKPWLFFLANEHYQEAFANIQDPTGEKYEATFKTLEDFVCKIYGTKKNGLHRCTSVNEARVKLFTQRPSPLVIVHMICMESPSPVPIIPFNVPPHLQLASKRKKNPIVQEIQYLYYK